MGILGEALERRLALLLMLSVLAAFFVGCGPEAPNDPQMSPQDESKQRESMYTPEQQEARAQRPR